MGRLPLPLVLVRCETQTICQEPARKPTTFSPSQPLQNLRNLNSGINIILSDAEFHEFPRQVEETTAFLEAHKDELSRLRSFPGIEAMAIDFGIARRDVYVQNDYLPPALIRLAGELGLGIELSQYPVSEEEESDPPPEGDS